MSTDTNSTNPLDFETALAQLEQLVQKLESGDLSLETSLQEYERGVQLTRVCQQALKQAEQRVQLVNSDGSSSDFPALGEH
ncbi:MAG: exodeoxyribonuclease VII small subunit [Thiotrichaceae bacterium]|jgi:exodeoxyribonuclease VII small subunit|uniref:Exodeoxyribonuclease 7 small subunit n=1 Tax=Candidatus Thiocaldithrix dubininis TaxID=3080823 RepID=A0AA95KKJ1_9GAMM|nr:MAG: exodeoxyribonuclease VII small subunit [Candidatus Thiocaldithrix dubininis]